MTLHLSALFSNGFFRIAPQLQALENPVALPDPWQTICRTFYPHILRNLRFVTSTTFSKPLDRWEQGRFRGCSWQELSVFWDGLGVCFRIILFKLNLVNYFPKYNQNSKLQPGRKKYVQIMLACVTDVRNDVWLSRWLKSCLSIFM